jgi:hypothetical protein
MVQDRRTTMFGCPGLLTCPCQHEQMCAAVLFGLMVDAGCCSGLAAVISKLLA